jgi:phage-related protein
LATEIGSAFISVGLGTNSLAGDIRKAFGSAESSGGAAGKAAGKGFGGGFVGIATAAIGALGIGTFLKGAITGAGDLQQSVGGIEAVFRGSSDQMLKFSDGASKAIGLTKDEYNQLGTVIGSQLKNGGVASDQLASKTNDLITTGGDLAAMFGGNTSDAVAALSSALKGERDPIEAYGVSLNQASIDAKAAELGFSKVGGSLSAEANQAATMALIMEQTADAHGAAAREADTFAAQQKTMSSGFKNLQADIGAAFLPALTGVFGFINTNVLPALDKFVAGLGSGGLAGAFAPIMAVAGPIFKSLASSFGPLIPQIVQLASSFSPLGLIFKVIQPILPQLVGLFTQLGSVIAGTLSTTLTALMPIVSMFIAQLSSMAIQLMPSITQIVGLLGTTLATLAPIIGQVIAQLAPLIMSLMTQLAPIITNLITSIMPPLIDIFGQIVGAIGPLVTILMGVLIPVIQALMPVVVTIFGVIADVIKNAMQIVMGIIQVVTGIISGDWGKVWAGIGNIFGGIWNTIVAVVGGAIKIVWSVISAGIGLVMGFIGSALGNIGRFFSDTWNNVVNGVSSMIGNVVGFFSGLIGKITGAIGNAGKALWDTGVNIIQGLIDGIGSMMGAIGRAVLSIVPEAIRGPFEDLLGIHSPSRVFRGYGKNIGQGLILGLDDMHGDIATAVTGLVSVPPVPSFGAGTYTTAGAAGAGASAGGFNNYGTIQVRDENEMARLILNKQQDAQAAYGF